jgi:hypothetical protein
LIGCPLPAVAHIHTHIKIMQIHFVVQLIFGKGKGFLLLLQYHVCGIFKGKKNPSGNRRLFRRMPGRAAQSFCLASGICRNIFYRESAS